MPPAGCGPLGGPLRSSGVLRVVVVHSLFDELHVIDSLSQVDPAFSGKLDPPFCPSSEPRCMYLSTLALGACDAVGHVPSLPFAIKVPPLTYL